MNKNALAEQHRIVAKVEELMTLCDQLETQPTTTQSDSEKLMEAILHEALKLRSAPCKRWLSEAKNEMGTFPLQRLDLFVLLF